MVLIDNVKNVNQRGIKTIMKKSESALDNAEFDYTIDSNSSLEKLIKKVKEILIKEKII